MCFPSRKANRSNESGKGWPLYEQTHLNVTNLWGVVGERVALQNLMLWHQKFSYTVFKTLSFVCSDFESVFFFYVKTWRVDPESNVWFEHRSNVTFSIPVGLSIVRNKDPLDKSSLMIILRLLLTNTSVIHHQVSNRSEYCCLTTGTVVTIRTTSFSIKILRSAHTVYLCVLCGSENKQRLFPYTALTDWFV